MLQFRLNRSFHTKQFRRSQVDYELLLGPQPSFDEATNSEERKPSMKEQLLRLQIRMRIMLDENGQDLIEYALVVALIAFAATVGMTKVANGINNAFTSIATKLSTYVS